MNTCHPRNQAKAILPACRPATTPRHGNEINSNCLIGQNFPDTPEISFPRRTNERRGILNATLESKVQQHKTLQTAHVCMAAASHNTWVAHMRR